MEIKARIQQKAKDLFYRYGIKSITMDEIANQLGASKKTIYQYFSDKDELVDSVVAQIIAEVQEICDRKRDNAKDAIHELLAAMDIIQSVFSGMNPAMLFDLERFHPQSYKRFLDHKNKYLYQVVKHNLQRGIEEELYRPDIDVDIMTRYRLEAMLIAFNQDAFAASKYNLVELQYMILEHFLFGVASLKGFKMILKHQQDIQKS